jgi:hypothetical protein
MTIQFAGDAEELPDWELAAERCGLSGDRHPQRGVSLTDERHVAAATVVGGSAAAVLSAARSIGESTPLLVLPLADSAGAVAYGLIPDVEDGRLILAGWTARAEPAVSACLAQFAAGTLGDLQVLQLDREVDGRAEPQPQWLTPDVVDDWFFEDVDLLRVLGGDFNRVTAVPLAPVPQGCRRMTVTLGTAGVVEAVWNLMPGVRHAWKLTITGTRGTAVLTQTGDQPVRFELNGVDHPVTGAAARDVVLREFARRAATATAADAASRPQASSDTTSAAVWSDFVRAADLLEGYKRSLRRRRTIDLHFDSHSERSQFKTQMTAIGCGVLTWAFLGTCLGLIVGGAFDPRDSSERHAAAAETIAWEADFIAGGIELTADAESRLLRQVGIDGDEAIVLIEQQGESGFSDVDSDRLSRVQALLGTRPETRRAQLTVRPLSGGWFRQVMIGIWLAAFVPLAIFLVFQLLLLQTRSSTRQDDAR